MRDTHIIRSQFFDVEFHGNEADALALQNRLFALCQGELGLALENVFDRCVPAKEHWIIDRLEVDAGSLPPESLERLVEAVTNGVERELGEWAPRIASTHRSTLADGPSHSGLRMDRVGATPPGTIQFRSDTQSLQEAFLYFLETGVLPWWFRLPAGKTLEDTILDGWQQSGSGDAQPEAFARALGQRMGSGFIRKRLVRQFSSDFLDTLLSAVPGNVTAAVREIFAELRNQRMTVSMPREFSAQVWENAFVSTFAGRHASVATLIAASLKAMPSATRQDHSLFFEQIESIWPQTDHGESKLMDARPALPSDTAQARSDSSSRLDLKEGVFTNCAGVVLLHPFLPRFFEGLGICEKKDLLQPERALCLLHYLATGNRFAPEYDLLLPKVLCNVPPDAPVDSRIELTAAEEQEAAALLSAVIRHWEALGNCSDENLRGSFLTRPGKLSQRDGEYLLQVETRSYDVLLDRLPWGLGLVQLPWMQKVLWVEWRF